MGGAHALMYVCVYNNISISMYFHTNMFTYEQLQTDTVVQARIFAYTHVEAYAHLITLICTHKADQHMSMRTEKKYVFKVTIQLFLVVESGRSNHTVQEAR